MGRSSRSRSSSLSARPSFVKRSSSNDIHRGNSTNAQNYSGGLAQQQSSGKPGFLSNMMGTVASGMATGVGFGVAQRAVDSVLGPRHMEVSHTNNNAQLNQTAAMNSERNTYRCQPYMDELNQCLLRHSDISLCQNYADSLKSCQQSM